MSVSEIANLPPIAEEDRSLAKTMIEAILRSDGFRLEADGKTFIVPPVIADLIVNVLNLTAENVSATVVPDTQELTIHQAATFLEITEARLLNLLDSGTIEFRQDGDHRMILPDSLIRFNKRRKQRLAGMREIVRLSEEMGLYDE